jgi:hypothetical protein
LPKSPKNAVTKSGFERLICKQFKNKQLKNMKTSAKTLFASALTAIVLSTSAFSSKAAEPEKNVVALSSMINFNKVVVKGNVHVELIQAEKQHVVVYEEYNKNATTIEQKGDKLFITSEESQPITIVVYVKDLQRIDVSNTASVSTKGKFSAPVLQVFLKDQASADVNASIGSLYTYTVDKSALKLRGTSTDHVLVKGKVARVRMDDFASANTRTQDLDESYLASVKESDSLIAGNKTKSLK